MPSNRFKSLGRQIVPPRGESGSEMKQTSKTRYMKTLYQSKLQHAALSLTVAMMQLEGKLTKTEADRRHNIIWRAYLNRVNKTNIY